MSKTIKIGSYEINEPGENFYNPPVGYDLSVEMAVDLYNAMKLKIKPIPKQTFYKYIKRYKIPHAEDHHGYMWFKSEELLELFNGWKPKIINYEGN